MGAEVGEVRGKLREGVRIVLFHPAWAASCKACLAFSRGNDGIFRYDFKGNPYPRPSGVPTPCRVCPKVPDYSKAVTTNADDLRATATELTPENRKAYERYKEFKAVGRFPDDPLVNWYSGIIREVEEEHDRYLEDKRVVPIEILTELIRVRYAR